MNNPSVFVVTALALSCSLPAQGDITQAEMAYKGMPESLAVTGNPYRVMLETRDDGSFSGSFEAGGKSISVQVAAASEEGKATVQFNAPDGPKVQSVPGSTRRSRTTWMIDQAISIDGMGFRVNSVGRGAGRDGQTTTMLTVFGGALYSEVEIGGETMHLAMVDNDGDGKIAGSGDRWLLLSDAQVAEFNETARGGKKRFNSSSMPRADHPVFLSPTDAVYLHEVKGKTAVLSRRAPEHSLSHYLHQRADDINKNYGRDLSQYEEDRPTAEAPIAWTYSLDLKPLLARAAKEKKPLLVDFETDWCGWCHVLDLVTYPDKEVAEFVNANFIPVKWNCELDPQQVHNQYEVRGFPSMVVIHPDGSKIDAIVGFSKPSEFIVKLKEKHAVALSRMQN